jgi:hypothetical protein
LRLRALPGAIIHSRAASLLGSIANRSMAFKNDWFHDRDAIKSPPAECVADCSAQGSVDDAVEYWVSELVFDGPAWLIREHLRGYGAWDRRELCDHQQNLRRLLWIWCCDIAENGDDLLYLMY